MSMSVGCSFSGTVDPKTGLAPSDTGHLAHYLAENVSVVVIGAGLKRTMTDVQLKDIEDANAGRIKFIVYDPNSAECKHLPSGGHVAWFDNNAEGLKTADRRMLRVLFDHDHPPSDVVKNHGIAFSVIDDKGAAVTELFQRVPAAMQEHLQNKARRKLVWLKGKKALEVLAVA